MKKKITAVLLSIVLFFSVFAGFGASVFAAEGEPTAIKITKESLSVPYTGAGQEVAVEGNLDHYTVYTSLEDNASNKWFWGKEVKVSFVFQKSLQDDMKTVFETTPENQAFVDSLAKNTKGVVALVTGQYEISDVKLNAILGRTSEFVYATPGVEGSITFDAYQFLCVAVQEGLNLDEAANLLTWFGAKLPVIDFGILDALYGAMRKVDKYSKITIGEKPKEVGLYLATAVGTWPEKGKGTSDTKIMTIKPAEATIKFDNQNGENVAVFSLAQIKAGAAGAHAWYEGKEKDGTFSIFTGVKDEGVIRQYWSGSQITSPGVYEQMAYVTKLLDGGHYYAKPVFRTVIVVDKLEDETNPDSHLEKYAFKDGKPNWKVFVDPETKEVTYKIVFDSDTYAKEVQDYETHKLENQQTAQATFVRSIRNTIANIFDKIVDPFKKGISHTDFWKNLWK